MRVKKIETIKLENKAIKQRRDEIEIKSGSEA